MEIFPEIIKRGGVICGGSETEAIKIFTTNAAYSVHEEKSKGSIEIGKDADFTIIGRDPYRLEGSREAFDIKVIMTIKGDEATYVS